MNKMTVLRVGFCTVINYALLKGIQSAMSYAGMSDPENVLPIPVLAQAILYAGIMEYVLPPTAKNEDEKPPIVARYTEEWHSKQA